MKKIISVALALLMMISIVPMSGIIAFAGSTDISNFSDVGLTIVSNDESTLAPGVTMNEIVVYDKNGERVEMYLTTTDTSVDTVKFYANYKDNDNSKWGMQTLSEQVAAIEANYDEPFKVVAGINASYYNTTNGAPMGAFVMEGVDMSASGNSYAFFAVLKDGTVMIGDKGEYSTYKDQIKEAIGGYHHIVKDGQVVSGLDKVTKYPRQTIGITADGRVITMTADGSQAPQTVGLTIQEQAEVMLALGCVDALHLDGGNSATFGAIREGSDEFETVNSPSGQSERAVSSTLMIVSTAVSDGTFDHAIILSDYDYYVPGSDYTFTAFGVDATNGPADKIPDAVTWALSDSSFGTIADGRFVSNGKLGEVDVQMVLDGEVVGSKTISIVNPQSITFGATEKTVPYGKTSQMTITAIYNNNEVYCVADDFNWTVADSAAGTLSGYSFTATTNESIKETTVSATYKNDPSVASISVTVKFGKGSDIIFNFEDGDISNWRGTDTINEWVDAENAKYTDATYTILNTETYGNPPRTQTTSVFLATEADGGHVKNGDYSLGFTINNLNAVNVGSWLYNYLYYTGETQVWRDVASGKSAVRVGMWVYFPEEAANTAFRICRTFTKDSSGKLYTNYDYMTSDYDGKKVSYNTDYAIPESGWVYVYFDLTAYDFQSSTQYNPQENYAANNGKTPTNGDYYPAFIQFIHGDKNDTMASLTFYIDDITLDYSDVIDDRDAPVISNAQVSESVDNFVALDGQTVTNNYLSFMANIADVTKTNSTGLDYSTAKIYIDGMDMSNQSSFAATGKVISLSDIYLTNGTHSIAFEVADKQGNYTKLTKTLTVAGTATNAVVSIAGHNDLGATPKTGSVYYIDVKATDAAQVKSIVTTLKLNTANTFEYEHIVAGNGVSVEYDYDALNHTLTLEITSDGTLTGDAVLASVPVRVWAWDEEATGISAATQFASGSIPVIDIECEAVYGEVAYFGSTYNSYVAGFYTEIDVKTEIDNSTAWHAHTATNLPNKNATCTEDGYTDRTYCDGCKSVVDWGETKEATGHNFAVVDGNLVCGECDVAFNDVIGLIKIGENYYYFVNGVAASGWRLIGSYWHYFSPTTFAAVSGRLDYDHVTYELEEDGKLANGIWAKTLFGMRYYYGPSYYVSGWHTIDGKDYLFENGYRLEGGWQLILESHEYLNWYYFNEDGTCDDKTLKPEDGFYTDRNGYAYSKDGNGLGGLRLIDGRYYAFDYLGYAQKNGTYYNYLFGDDYAAYTGLVDNNGTLCYYENGKAKAAGLVEIDGYIYFAGGSKGEVATGKTYVWEGNGILPQATYEFGADGKMLNGIVDKDGVLYYYENGQPRCAGLVEVDGALYFAGGSKGEVAIGKTYVWNGNGIRPNANYEFGADGKMLNGIVDKDGVLYYYVDGQPRCAGLVEVDGALYFAGGSKGEVTVNAKTYVWEGNGILPNANYEFGADGKMLNGIVDKNGTLYYYVDGQPRCAGLVEVDGALYFAGGSRGEVTVNAKTYVWNGNGILPQATYEFGADGKMLNGIVDVNGTLYYYEDGQPRVAGLVEVDGALYFAGGSRGEVTVGKMTYVWNGNGILAEGNYEFGADGKMLDGFVTKADGIYYYENGQYGRVGLNYIDGYYYFINYGGKLITSERYYVWETNGLSIKMSYTFDALGRVIA